MRKLALLSVIALAACSAGGGGGNGAAPAAGGSNGGSATASSSLNLTDACATLPREGVAKAVGKPLQSAELKDVMPDSGNGMASSSCVYDFGNASLVILQLNRFPNGADMATIFDGTRNLLSKEGSVPVEDVPGLGQRAFWVPSSNDLYVMLDDNRQVSLSTFRLDDVAGAKDKLIGLARQVVG